MNPVLDASVFVAASSPQERHHAAAVSLLESTPEDAPFLVPAIFRVEVIAAFARRGESESLLDAMDALVRGPRFRSVQVDGELLELAAQVARSARVRAYDAVYCALALARSAPLFTLDRVVRDKLAVAYPGLTVRAG